MARITHQNERPSDYWAVLDAALTEVTLGEKAQELLLFYAGMNEGAEITASALQSETSLTLTGSQTYKNALLLKRLILRNRRLNLIVVNWKRIKLLAELSRC